MSKSVLNALLISWMKPAFKTAIKTEACTGLIRDKDVLDCRAGAVSSNPLFPTSATCGDTALFVRSGCCGRLVQL
ncbi:MAG: hypothetical protein ACKERG_03440 [Candidatus Hodgkinia cicadicola]